MIERPRVGLALSAGAVRGLAHIGVLKVLEREGVPIDCIAGSSVGALVGAVYSSCRDLGMMERLATNMKWDLLVDVSFPRMGLVGGERLMEFLRLVTGGKTFEELSIPLAVVAVDIERGEEVVFRDGPVAEAVRASIAVPGVFVPHRYRGRMLVDGAVLNRVPVAPLRGMGADVVIAVKLWGRGPVSRVRNVVDVVLQSIELMETEIMNRKMLDADVVIEPNVSAIGPARLDKARELIDLGEMAAREVIHRLKLLAGGGPRAGGPTLRREGTYVLDAQA